MGHLTYEESKSKARTIILILAAMTLVEVIFCLYAKGHLVEGAGLPGWLLAFVMIAMSLIKAYLIVFEFMHMKYEVSGMMKSVLLPTLLLVWAVIAFFYEGADWNKRRTQIEEFDKAKIGSDVIHKQSGELIRTLNEDDFIRG